MKRVWVTLVSILVIAGAGYFGWQSWGQNPSPQTNKDPSEGGKYLVITEWGVRFEIPENLRKSVSYEKGAGLVDDTETFLIHSSNIDLSKSKCGSENGEVFVIYRLNKTNGTQTYPPKFKSIGDYDYFLNRCEDYGLDASNTQRIDSLERSIEESLEIKS